MPIQCERENILATTNVFIIGTPHSITEDSGGVNDDRGEDILLA